MSQHPVPNTTRQDALHPHNAVMGALKGLSGADEHQSAAGAAASVFIVLSDLEW